LEIKENNMKIEEYLNKPMYAENEPEILFILSPSEAPESYYSIVVKLVETGQVVNTINKDVAEFAIKSGSWRMVEKSEYQQAKKHIDNMLADWSHLMESPEIFDAYPQLRKALNKFDYSQLITISNILTGIISESKI